MLQNICLFIVLCTFFSCQSFVTHNTLSKLEKGMTPEKVYEITDEKPKKEFSIKVNGKLYDVSVLDLKTGQSTSTYTSGTGTQMMTYSQTNHHTNNFYLLYQGGKLRYWGMRNEFSKSEDPEIASLSSELYSLSDDIK
jgi:hypothetical protein